MRIAVTTFGSEGDVRPFAALARALRAAGHDAFLCAANEFQERAAQAGIPFVPTGPMFRGDPVEARKQLARVVHEPSPLQSGRIVFEVMAPEILARLRPLLEATAGVDLVVHHVIDVAGFAAAMVHGKRRVSAALSPGIWNNRRVMVDGRSLGAWLNLGIGAVVRRLYPYMTDRHFLPVIAAAGLPGPRKNIILEMAGSSRLRLLAVSPSMVAPDPTWPANLQQPGYWYLDLPGWEPPPGLRAFVEDGGDPPLTIGFGSMGGVDAGRRTEIIVGAVERLRRRAVLLAGWAELGEGNLPTCIHVADHVPHDWLYPRSSLVVHHGGAGTTAAVARAGAPQAIVWHLGDQSTWGELVRQHGMGPGPLHHQKLTADRLAALIEVADRPEKRAAARAMGERIRAEDGLGAAVRAISALSS